MKAALLLAERFGWAVVPLHSARADGACTCSKGTACTSAGKHPRLAEWTTEATDDANTLREWWEQWPEANLGVATGEASGFFVLDVDPAHGGVDALAELLAQHGPLPLTTEQATGSGGSHYLFALPEGRSITNSASKVGRGLDIRGDGGQIVVAPSRSARGQYRWVRPPWETPPAEAPAWLLAALSRAAAPRAAIGEDARGYFPAASPAVLDEARAALEKHGPAIDGQGGGLHTVHACALLTHDFALTDDEAWPLVEEWNETCVPPWELDDLRERLRRGRKYGKREYGCRRTLDVVDTARKWIADWQVAGTAEAGFLGVLERLRPLLAKTDVTRHALVERELAAASGLKGRALGLPKPSGPAAPPPPLKQGEIKVSTDLHRVADESTAAIAPLVFARNGALVEVVKAERTFIHELEPARIQDLMSRTAVYVRNDEKQGAVTVAAPGPVASILHARREHRSIRVLEAVTTAPVFLADGSVLRERGYNAQARVFLEPDVDVDVPDAPTREDARRAVALFRDLVCDVRFATEADFSSWVSAVLSPLVKAATGNAPAPLICISAPSAGVGKTLLSDLVACIVTGAGAEVRPYNPRDAAEWGKKLTAFVKAGSPVSVFDNVNGPFGDEALDRLITSTTWSDRQLGATEAPPLPVVSTWLATGNNIEPQGDTVRRVLVVRLDVKEERPQERAGFKRPDLPSYAREQRGELLSAALTLLRAYHCAGRPDMRLAAWGSFTAWSALVRGALVWAGLEDPFRTQARASAELSEPDNEAHDFWLDVVSGSDGTPGSIVLLANQRQARQTLGTRDELTAHGLRRFLGRFVDKPRAGRRIRRARNEQGVTKYVVERLA